MANIRSAKKRTRQTERRTTQNRARASRLRTYLRKVEEAIASGDKKAAQEAFRSAQPELMRGAQKNIVHRNAAARKLSRLSADAAPPHRRGAPDARRRRSRQLSMTQRFVGRRFLTHKKFYCARHDATNARVKMHDSPVCTTQSCCQESAA